MALVLPADKSVVKEKTVTDSFFELKLHPNDLKITLLVLNATRDDTKSQLQKAYRELARKWHPDRHKTDEAKEEAETMFRLIATAYETLKDDEVRQEYDYLLDNPDELYRHYWYYYKRKAAPNVDFRLVLLATVFIISAIQRFKEEIKADEELILKAIIEENIDVKGGYKQPSMKNTLLVWIVFSPYYIYDYSRFTADWIWRFWIKKEEYGETEKLYLIRKNLKLSQDLFDAMEESERGRMMKDELWIKEKFTAWKTAKEEEERRKAAESGRAKSIRRYMKNHASQMSFVDEDF